MIRNGQGKTLNFARMASSSSECSTLFEGSAVSVASASAASEQYDDNDFDDYSDSFESDDDGTGSDAASAAAVAAANSQSSETNIALLSAGTRVQVFWIEENKWFDGLIQRVEEGNETRYFVQYDDGEQAWEGPAKIRPLPAALTTADEYDQGQRLLPLSEHSARELVGRKAIVYWPDEAELFDGVVSSAQASPAALLIEYDDGDSRWEQEHTFNCILLQRPAVETSKAQLSIPDVVAAPRSPPERVLFARPFRQVVSDHFQPVRIARPYHCVVARHSDSVIIARRPYSERRYLHTVHEALECSRCGLQATAAPHPGKSDTIVQTTLSSLHPESQSM